MTEPKADSPMTDQGGVRERLGRLGMMPLRLFFGVTFLYAGIDKFTGWGPFSSYDRSAMERSLEFARDGSAVPWLVDLTLDHPGLFLTGAAVAEIVIGAALLAGLLTRIAALGGALLTLSLWLTVTWNAEPYYFGADLPYFFGFLTLVLTGAGAYSLDGRFFRGR